MIMGWFWIWPVLVLIGLVLLGYLAFRLAQGRGSADQTEQPSAREILDQRYARGDLSDEEYRGRAPNCSERRSTPSMVPSPPLGGEVGEGPIRPDRRQGVPAHDDQVHALVVLDVERGDRCPIGPDDLEGELVRGARSERRVGGREGVATPARCQPPGLIPP
jgi:putative membrane protein